MSDKFGINCFISGRVQGVWFRASTQKEAVKLGVTGWVRNLPDGRVEVMAYGTSQQLNALREWLKRGPEHAVVQDVVCEEKPWHEYETFEVV